MNTYIPGTFVVAVSGGVDSMVLLDLLTRIGGMELVVAHFEHGIRDDSVEDLRHVEAAAGRYGLPFVYARGNLGKNASEVAAREARYAFLHKVRCDRSAQAIVTAHHQGDLVETALINLARGTGRQGLSALKSTDTVIRPLLGHTKQQLIDYATANNITWREDSTNSDERYLRNYLRRRVLPAMTPEQHEQLLRHIYMARHLNDKIDTILRPMIQQGWLDRQWFIMLPHDVSMEVMAAWLRHHQAAFDRRMVERLVRFAKTALPGKRLDVDKKNVLQAGKEHITLLVKSANL
jgi:tRNA(Ile)-lysidine synthetase-like protein